MLCYIIYSNTRSDERAYSKNKFIQQLTESMPLYNWQKLANDTSSEASQAATRLWDDVQLDLCCGLNSYREWDAFRPPGLPDSFYPRSCCEVASETHNGQGPFCLYTNQMYWSGCVESAAKIWETAFSMYTFYVVLFFSFSILAYLVSVEGENGPMRRPNVSARRNNTKIMEQSQSGDVAPIWHSTPNAQGHSIYPNPFGFSTSNNEQPSQNILPPPYAYGKTNSSYPLREQPGKRT